MIDSSLIEKMIEADLAEADEIVGCSDAEIAELEKKFQVQLPQSYKDFLSKMGKSAGWLLQGSDFYYPEVIKCRGSAERLLERDESEFRLSASSFVFLQHQGYQFFFFDTAEAAEPPVYRYIEGDEKPEKVGESFSTWLEKTVMQEAELEAKVKDKRP